MVKKYMMIHFFVLCYTFMSFHTYAKTEDFQKNGELKRKEENKNHNPSPNSPEIFLGPSRQKSEPLKMHKDSIDSDLTCTKDIPFTVAQKKRLDQIYHRIYLDYIDLIETYAWAGALTQDQKLVRYKMLKNYVLTFQKRNYKWCSEYEEDEWEEEWFNSDND